jgi:hypothetical protein
MKKLSFILPVLVAASSTLAAPVALQNATATHSQDANLSVYRMIESPAVNSNYLGWAANGLSATAAFETVSDATGPQFVVTLKNESGLGTEAGYAPSFTLACFRVSVTNDNRADFADGLASGGDVTANWTVLTPVSAVISTTGWDASALSLLNRGDDALLLTPATTPPAGAGNTTIYTVTYNNPLANVTGFRLEALEDASLPGGGPGTWPADGNMWVSEFSVQVVPEPATLGLMSLGALALLRRKH